MFYVGQQVKCVNSDMGQELGSSLEKGKIYTVEGFISPEDCRQLPDNDNYAEFEKRGGRVAVTKALLFFYADRFEAVKTL